MVQWKTILIKWQKEIEYKDWFDQSIYPNDAAERWKSCFVRSWYSYAVWSRSASESSIDLSFMMESPGGCKNVDSASDYDGEHHWVVFEQNLVLNIKWCSGMLMVSGELPEAWTKSNHLHGLEGKGPSRWLNPGKGSRLCEAQGMTGRTHLFPWNQKP